MEIRRLIWLEDIVEKLIWKHNVVEGEVFEVFENNPNFRWKEPGHRYGEDVYAVYGKTDANRYLSIFFIYTQDKQAIIVSARDITNKERRKYVR